ncbi:hypothetical protein ACFPRL_26300 [Pseudoclavibacter helvolus]
MPPSSGCSVGAGVGAMLGGAAGGSVCAGPGTSVEYSGSVPSSTGTLTAWTVCSPSSDAVNVTSWVDPGEKSMPSRSTVAPSPKPTCVTPAAASTGTVTTTSCSTPLMRPV